MEGRGGGFWCVRASCGDRGSASQWHIAAVRQARWRAWQTVRAAKCAPADCGRCGPPTAPRRRGGGPAAVWAAPLTRWRASPATGVGPGPWGRRRVDGRRRKTRWRGRRNTDGATGAASAPPAADPCGQRRVRRGLGSTQPGASRPGQASALTSGGAGRAVQGGHTLPPTHRHCPVCASRRRRRRAQGLARRASLHDVGCTNKMMSGRRGSCAGRKGILGAGRGRRRNRRIGRAPGGSALGKNYGERREGAGRARATAG